MTALTDGGSSAAFGFSFQYLVTAVYTLQVLATGGRDPGAITLVVEPTAAAGPDGSDDDIVDFAVLVDDVMFRRVQVKASRRPEARVLAPAEAGAVFERLDSLCQCGESVLLTNRQLAPSLAKLCSSPVNDRLGSNARWIDASFSAATSNPQLIVTKDVAEVEGLYEGLICSIRRDKSQSQGVVSSRLVGVMLRHRIFEAAAGSQPNSISGTQLLALLTMPDSRIAHAVGGFDWGNPQARIPSVKSPVPRLDILNRVGAELEVKDRTPPIVVMAGHTGAGKTIVATDYCHLNHNRFEQVLWLDARDDGLLFAQIREYAARLTGTADDAIADPIDLLSTALGAHRGPWLLVFDAAPGRTEIERYVPTVGHGAVLITTTNSVGWWPTAHVLEIGPFSSAEALMCFAVYAGIDDSDIPAVAGTIQMIVDRLGLIPLAISMAGLYFRNADSDLAELAPAYFATLEALDDTVAVPPGFNRTAFAAVTAAVDQIGTGSDSPYIRNARVLMYTASFLAPELIPLNLLIPATTDPITIDMGNLPAPAAADPRQTRAIVTLLRTQTIAHRVLATSAADRQDLGADCIQIHPLISEILRTQYVTSAPPGAVQNAVTVLLGHLIPWLGQMRTSGSFLVLEQLRVHAETLIEFLDTREPLATLSPQHNKVYLTAKAGVLGELSNYYANTARLQQSAAVQEQLVVHYLQHFPHEEWAQVFAMTHASNMLTDLSLASVAPLPLSQIAGRVLGLMKTLEARGKPSTKAAVYRIVHLSVQMVSRVQSYRDDPLLARIASEMEVVADRDPNKEISPEWLMKQLNSHFDQGEFDAVLKQLKTLRAVDSSLNDAVTFDALEVVALLNTGALDKAFELLERLVATKIVHNNLILDLRDGLAKVAQALHTLRKQHAMDQRFSSYLDQVVRRIRSLNTDIAAVQQTK